jgi:methylphosphotriester-DNA--protein-cysteine methyltransferase
MIHHCQIEPGALRSRIKAGQVKLGGNIRLGIYGRLGCRSGKRMKRENRVFFESGNEAVQLGYRPCGHCMREEYLEWKRLQMEKRPAQGGTFKYH